MPGQGNASAGGTANQSGATADQGGVKTNGGASVTANSTNGGTPSNGGTSKTGDGGSVGIGGVATNGGGRGDGGASADGGATSAASGSSQAVGGSSRGSPGAGGTSPSGGGANRGGNASKTGGASNANGGAPSGGKASGGAPSSVGSTVPGNGGAPPVGNCPGSCTNAAIGSCSAPQVRISSVALGSTLSYSADETYNIPLAIAAKPGGGSYIAWMTSFSRYGSSTASQVHVAELDCEDKLVGTPFVLDGHDFQDIAADGNGGVITLTRDGQATGDAQHCGDVNSLCVTPGDRPGCYDHYLVRFDCAGVQQWATKLTTTSATSPLYSPGGGYNYGVWWYQHHGRIATDGSNFAAYFCDSITVANKTCSAGTDKVDIHEGDRMQVVDPSGALLSGHDSFDLGCSHSWTTRLVWDPRTSHFVTVCATDNNCRIARSPNYQTIVSATCDGTLFGGDVVLAGNTGYWMAWSYQNVIKLEHFTTGASDKTVTTAGNAQNPHLVALGASNMLLTWKSGTGLAAQVYDTTTGATVGAQFTIAVPDHPWQSWKPFPDGSAAWASVASASSTVQIARVLPCTN